MSWYNNIKKLEENRDAFFRNVLEVDYNLLNICLRRYFIAKKNVARSSALTSKRESTQKQRIRHELNCEDLEQKRMILDECIKQLA